MQNFFKSSCLQCSQSVCVISNFLSFYLDSSLHILGSSSLGWWLRPATSCSPATTLSISTSTASPTGDTAPFLCNKGPYVSRDIQESWSNIWTSPIIKVLHEFGIISNNTTISKHLKFLSTVHPPWKYGDSNIFYVVISELPFVICCCAGRGG